ncbi:ATP synthase subunit C [Rothia sp. HMSC058E10]|jgi:ATP synthase F0, C subunit|uniref:ATP synthase subunit c n=3 Tax=Rothia TaxID=32207 RepID=A0A269YKW5_9MICC|nr:ATP synthase subunit c [Rothia dentocariosa ATCC 17931]EFJ77057.1 ATP synthase subunit c [Rothia dentocariosa M567]MBF1649317.1 ATP synthase F0 subunit C [Rothia dentocariosa]OFK73976.1 ATP synthase subunit C [Rothia sp. HMSC065G12]OFN04708.1 ATP synthase subunit C [Rothia sp. HMSC064D08]OFN15358.1 ATP synthase subunit C [Rothia sp. HMSC058E10]OFN45763.1 ATP synthase subunit C [Rothia sp. HMSC071F11]OFO74729.1 ATP synthase subunit C [Rothia sp. HMSC065D02]OFP56168.1 ATP synthase subunit 
MNVIGYGLAAIGGGIGVGLIFAAYMTSVARQPESQRTLQPMLFMGFAVVEALAILGLVLAFII